MPKGCGIGGEVPKGCGTAAADVLLVQNESSKCMLDTTCQANVCLTLHVKQTYA